MKRALRNGALLIGSVLVLVLLGLILLAYQQPSLLQDWMGVNYCG